MKKAVVIGSGFSGMSAASFLAKAGWQVVVLERHDIPGGRARNMYAEGFTFDMGPSWYWMPGIFERYFGCFGKKVSDYYHLERLDPSYRVYWPEGYSDIPADLQELRNFFEATEKGAAVKLDEFLKEAAFKYEVGINKLVFKPGRSLTEFIDMDLAKGVLKLDVFTSMKKHVRKYFTSPKLLHLLEFPVLFLGAMPGQIPALYSLMNYADIKLGTWYPQGGMYKIVEGMYDLAKEQGVKFYFGHDVNSINVKDGKAGSVTATSVTGEQIFEADVVVGSADYHFIETSLLEKKYRSYTDKYWDKRVMAPSCLLYYVGINKKLKDTRHHTLFFDVDFDRHAKEIYESPQWPQLPLFYVSATSVTDKSGAPEGHENLFFLIPVAPGMTDSDEIKESLFKKILQRFEERTGENINEHIVYKKSYGVSDFVDDYHAFKGNAYGLANTLMQTAILKPSIKSKKISNLFYAGQLTVPGPGVPPSLISGEVVAGEIVKEFTNG